MIDKLLGAFWPYVLLAFAVVLMGACGYGAWQHHAGYVAGKAEVTAAVERATNAERERQFEANTKAQAEAREREQQLAAERDRLQSIIEDNAREADQDPLRDSCGIGPDGSLRLNKLRRNSPLPISPTAQH
jgi:predicted  nucleic acid-binding Zn-ribbon protein